MDAEVAKAIEDLNKRISYQESTHAHVGEGGKESNGGSHGIVTNIPIIIISVLVASAIAIIMVNKYKSANG